MHGIRNLLEKNRLILYILIIAIAFAVFSAVKQEPQVSIKPLDQDRLPETAKLLNEVRELRERLARVEPPSPVKIVSADSVAEQTGAPVPAVITGGTRLPFEVAYEDMSWARPSYEPYWHSKEGQWSSVPDRIRASYHRLFVTPWTEGLWNETIHEVGIAEIAEDIKLPVYDDEPGNTVAVIAIQHKITDVLVLNNQVVLLGTPARTGLQVITINKQDIVNTLYEDIVAQNTGQEFMFQLVTPDGYEIDYAEAIINF